MDGLDKGESESTITTQTLIAQLGNGLVKREFSASKAEPETSNSPHTKESSEQVQQEVLQHLHTTPLHMSTNGDSLTQGGVIGRRLPLPGPPLSVTCSDRTAHPL
jgi:hypothetical protein